LSTSFPYLLAKQKQAAYVPELVLSTARHKRLKQKLYRPMGKMCSDSEHL
jgi:hypothetical protein